MTLDTFNLFLNLAESFGLPFVVDFFSKRSWPGEYKSYVLWALSFLITAAQLYLTGQLDISNLLVSIVIVVGASHVNYETLLKQWSNLLLDKGLVKDPAPVTEAPAADPTSKE